MPKASKQEIEKQTALLKGWFPEGSTVYTVLRHVSTSGMSREHFASDREARAAGVTG